MVVTIVYVLCYSLLLLVLADVIKQRVFIKLKHFEQFVGYQARVKLKVPFEGRKNYSGVIAGVEKQAGLLQQGETEYEFPAEHIERGQLVVTDVTQVGGSKDGK